MLIIRTRLGRAQVSHMFGTQSCHCVELFSKGARTAYYSKFFSSLQEALEYADKFKAKP